MLKVCLCVFTSFLALVTGVPFVLGAAGSLDSSFNGDGKVIRQYSPSPSSGKFTANAIQPDGKILFAGNGTIFGPSGETDGFIVIRYNANGTLDSTFGDGGIVELSVGNFENVGGMAIQPDGKILVSGTRYAGTTATDFSVLRFNANGTPDNSFDGNGLAVANISGVSNEWEGAIALQPDGKILVVGQTDNQTQYASMDWAIVRFNTNGTLDNEFDGDGKRIVELGGTSEIISSIGLQSTGKIICGGTSSNGSNEDFTLMRLNMNGSTDSAFGVNGITKTQVGAANDTLNILRILPDGKILTAGAAVVGSNSDIAIVRYSVDGQLDQDFGIGGIVIHPSEALTEEIFGLQIRPDGRFYVSFRSGSSSAVARFTALGALDPSFGTGGKVSTQIATSTGAVPHGLAIQSDGKLIASGVASAQSSFGPSYFYILRYLADGTKFDFDGDGKADQAVFRPAEGVWYLLQSRDSALGYGFGLAGDQLTAADYDGDGKTDPAIYREGVWWVLNSNGTEHNAIQWGIASDIPVAADYDGDGKADRSVYRDGTWWILFSSGAGYTTINWGIAGDKPVPADYDGDGKADFAVYRNGEWWILFANGSGYDMIQSGQAGDKPVPADYDGDGIADIAFYREGEWSILNSMGHTTITQWGMPGDVPVPADYDGDGRTDISIYRTGEWWTLYSNGYTNNTWGIPNDVPVSVRY